MTERHTLDQLRKLKPVFDQLRWIAAHGQSMEGYVERYGDAVEYPCCMGEGGQIIWLADMIDLSRRIARAYPDLFRDARIFEEECRTQMTLWFSFRRMCMGRD